MKLTQTFYFEAAHTLKKRHTDVHTMMKSETIHGHTYHASISVEGEIGEDGMVKDFNSIGYMVDFVKSNF